MSILVEEGSLARESVIPSRSPCYSRDEVRNAGHLRFCLERTQNGDMKRTFHAFMEAMGSRHAMYA